MTKDYNNSRDLLNDAIREASGAPAPARPDAAVTTKPQRKMTIAEALQEHQAAPPAKSGVRAERNSGATHSAIRRPVNSSPDSSHESSLHEVLAEVGAGGTASGAAPARASANLIMATLVETVSGIEPPTQTATSVAIATRRRFSGITLALLLLVGAAGYWWSQQRSSSPAAVLRDLATTVEQYRAEHPGTLPASLVPLKTFPQGAVEWPLRYWKARDAAGRTEIIWVPQNGHYRIMLRQGNEVWTVTDREREPKLFMKEKT